MTTSFTPASTPALLTSVAAPSTPAATGVILTSEQLKRLLETSAMVPKLDKKSSFGFFSSWSSAIEDWLLMEGLTPDNVHPSSLKMLTRHVFQPELHEELRRQSMINGHSWSAILQHLRSLLGVTAPALRAKLRECIQSRDEGPKHFVTRFMWLKDESGVKDEEARDLLLNKLNAPTLKYLEGKLEAIIDAGSLPADTTTDSIPLSTLTQLLSRDPLLQAFPAKPHQLSLSVNPSRPASNTINTVSQVFSRLPTTQTGHSTSASP